MEGKGRTLARRGGGGQGRGRGLWPRWGHRRAALGSRRGPARHGRGYTGSGEVEAEVAGEALFADAVEGGEGADAG